MFKTIRGGVQKYNNRSVMVGEYTIRNHILFFGIIYITYTVQ
jgi:hypothetical protein